MMSYDEPVEKWLPVPGYEDAYLVSDIGRVYLLRARRLAVTKVHGRGLYRKVGLWDGRAGVMTGVHRVVAAAFIGPAPEGMEVRHKDGDSLNNCAENLEYGTVSQNAQDKITHGRNQWLNKTHCPQGHSYSGSNLYISPKGHRGCRACRAQSAERFARKRRET
jgi:HNH endonuclease/NUMOD4 motif